MLRAGQGGTWLAFSPVMSLPSTLSPPASEPSATRTFLSLSLALYVLATSLGLLLRVSFIQPLPWLHFGHALHAHSHTLYFGWAGLGLLTLAYEQVGATGRWPWGDGGVRRAESPVWRSASSARAWSTCCWP